MRLLSAVQEIISQKNINNIVYNKNLVFPKSKSNLSQKLGIDYWSMISDPPTNDSKATTNDLTTVIASANNRTKSETDLVFLVDKDPLKLFLPFLKENNIDFPYKKFDQLYIFLKEMIKDLKFFYNRARPLQLAKFYNVTLDVIHTKTHHTASYPSGHTAYAALAACVLQDLYPEHSDYYWAAVDKCGFGRVLQGVHYPGDNTASIGFVKRVYKALEDFDKKHFSQ